MDTIHTILYSLVVGIFMYTTGVFVWFQKKFDALTSNHLQHMVRQEVQRQMELSGSQVDVSTERSDIIDNVD